jgi:hypothetical protein
MGSMTDRSIRAVPTSSFTVGSRDAFFDGEAHLELEEEGGVVGRAEMMSADLRDCRRGEAANWQVSFNETGSGVQGDVERANVTAKS